jgi:hypothetical protein
MFKKIFEAAKKGWISGGVQWREEFVEKGIDPDKFIALPNNEGVKMIAQYLKLPKQGQVQFLNMTTRSKLFQFVKID